MIIYYQDAAAPEVCEAGGKGKALWECSDRGLPVPPFLILTVSFFKPWMEQIRLSEEFQTAVRIADQESCDTLKEKAASLRFNMPGKARGPAALFAGFCRFFIYIARIGARYCRECMIMIF